MFNKSTFSAQRAIELYLGKKHSEIDWSKISCTRFGPITKWEIAEKPEPTIQHLKDLFFPVYYKALQVAKIKNSFDSVIVSGGTGCQTTVPDGEGGYIKVDCKKTPYKDDLQNFEKLKFFLEQTGQTQTYIKDYFNQMRLVTLTDLATIVLQLTGYGLGLYQVKWEKEAILAAMEQEEGESIEDYVARLETVTFP